ncbi:ZIP zinc transporter 1 [Schizosaccharomyces cryophilus OY26]|uniref:ZIP zinc transporter 1 n=1 Tax=Schizosaccharomyces cryophilus (strain OY26 / ATCC MYA-4695 / CBS 11777 / NBRC 106824 / NRRL Y48691) TaxID=653667 RepID=S9X7S5_SCHCR|nr:ZIP zinc transporter 1 [Schizosaccharomyces cryophilus OY26]EPY53187.1 ZIP zinc transporter 1 [Schizosaccharomyces cryophilus OY26]
MWFGNGRWVGWLIAFSFFLAVQCLQEPLVQGRERESILAMEKMRYFNPERLQKIMDELVHNEPSLLSISKTGAGMSEVERKQTANDIRMVMESLRENEAYLESLKVSKGNTQEQGSSSKEKCEHSLSTDHPLSSSIKKKMEELFSFTPSVNGFFATFLTSIPPNIFILIVPKNLNTGSLNLFVALSAGSLLGDVFGHLLPEIYEKAEEDSSSTSSIVSILAGILLFFIMDKGLRILLSSNGHGGHHGHHVIQTKKKQEKVIPSSSTTQHERHDPSSRQLRKRRNENKKETKDVDDDDASIDSATQHDDDNEKLNGASSSEKTIAYLNLFSDCFHNFMDGLAITTSFFANTSIGITTTCAVFLHEIPAEIGDLAILMRNGYTKLQTFSFQLVTMFAGLLGSITSIWIHSAALASVAKDDATLPSQSSIAAFLLQLEDKLLPFSAGCFLYIACLGVFPELLELNTKQSKRTQFCYAVASLICIVIGFLFLVYI